MNIKIQPSQVLIILWDSHVADIRYAVRRDGDNYPQPKITYTYFHYPTERKMFNLFLHNA